MSDAAWPEDDRWLTQGVLARRVCAWLVDLGILLVLACALWLLLLVFGLLTLGLGLPLLGLLPLLPFAYHTLFTASGLSATPGQRLFGLIVRRDEDLGQPRLLQAMLSTVLFYLTLATSGLLLVVALFTIRKRTLHDLISGLVVARERALTAREASWNMRPEPPYR